MQNGSGRVYEVDVDKTLCTETFGEYWKAEPIEKNIAKVNKLYDNGHIININTGRGSTTGIDWYSLTELQLKKWGVKYHSLTVGKKPYYDVIVDDKAINSEEEEWE
jgi:hypothetical protein